MAVRRRLAPPVWRGLQQTNSIIYYAIIWRFATGLVGPMRVFGGRTNVGRALRVGLQDSIWSLAVATALLSASFVDAEQAPGAASEAAAGGPNAQA